MLSEFDKMKFKIAKLEIDNYRKSSITRNRRLDTMFRFNNGDYLYLYQYVNNEKQLVIELLYNLDLLNTKDMHIVPILELKNNNEISLKMNAKEEYSKIHFKNLRMDLRSDNTILINIPIDTLKDNGVNFAKYDLKAIKLDLCMSTDDVIYKTLCNLDNEISKRIITLFKEYNSEKVEKILEDIKYKSFDNISCAFAKEIKEWFKE